jgi:hypothetical protein
MAEQPRSAPFAAEDDPATRANYGGTSPQPGTSSATGPTGPVGGQNPNGGGIPLPIPGLPGNIDPKRVLWWGGLGALAAVGIIEWPVAAVVGVGSYVAERWARDDARRSARQPS